MSTKKALFFLLSLVMSLGFPQTRRPNVAGAFYPLNEKELKNQIQEFLQSANLPSLKGDVKALIAPHAGYVFSGRVAGYSFKTIENKEYNTVLILGPSHYVYFEGISVYPQGVFETPLGKVEVDSEISQKILKEFKKAKVLPEAFLREHSVEVEIPFLQVVLRKGFKIVPVVVGELTYTDLLDLSKIIKDILEKENVLLVISSDFSHYHPSQEAEIMDSQAIELIKKLDAQDFYFKCQRKEIEACGYIPITLLLLTAKELNLKSVFLKYLHSGYTSGDFSKVVGYCAFVFIQEKNKEESMLNKKQREELLKIARKSIKEYLEKGEVCEFEVQDPELKKPSACFVTLKKYGNLRGCIGRIVADLPLYKAVSLMAIEAAFRDPRFPSLAKDEFNDMEIEISILTPFKKITDIQEIEVGKHGLFIKRGFFSGLLLPQVATEYNWDRLTFLEHTCLKAGLSPNCWKDKDTQIYTFTAEVFNEKEY